MSETQCNYMNKNINELNKQLLLQYIKMKITATFISKTKFLKKQTYWPNNHTYIPSVIKWPSNYSPRIMLNTLNYILWVHNSKNNKCHLQSSSIEPARFKSIRLIDISSSWRLLPLSCSSCSCTSLAVRSCHRKFLSWDRVRGYSTHPPTASGFRCCVIW